MGALPNCRNERFAVEVVSGKTLREAYKLAGFRYSRSNASRLRARPDVAARITEMQDRIAKGAVLSRLDLLRVLELVILANVGDLFLPDGSLRPLHSLPASVSCQLASIVRRMERAGASYNVRLVDRRAYIELYARLAGYAMAEEVAGTGAGEKAEAERVSVENAARRIADILSNQKSGASNRHAGRGPKA